MQFQTIAKIWKKIRSESAPKKGRNVCLFILVWIKGREGFLVPFCVEDSFSALSRKTSLKWFLLTALGCYSIYHDELLFDVSDCELLLSVVFIVWNL